MKACLGGNKKQTAQSQIIAKGQILLKTNPKETHSIRNVKTTDARNRNDSRRHCPNLFLGHPDCWNCTYIPRANREVPLILLVQLVHPRFTMCSRKHKPCTPSKPPVYLFPVCGFVGDDEGVARPEVVPHETIKAAKLAIVHLTSLTYQIVCCQPPMRYVVVVVVETFDDAGQSLCGGVMTFTALNVAKKNVTASYCRLFHYDISSGTSTHNIGIPA